MQILPDKPVVLFFVPFSKIVTKAVWKFNSIPYR